MTIFVNMAAYRDPECPATVQDMFRKAKYPDDIHVCIVLQTEAIDDLVFFQKNVQMIVIKASEGRGACWARSLGYRLYDGEDFVLQIDSHMRFVEDWDVKMVEQLELCKASRPMLTTYPPAYLRPDELQSHLPTFLAAERFEPGGHLIQRGFIHGAISSSPRPSALMSANFLFGEAGWIHDIPYDPHLYFAGEETTMAARLWTGGWNMFGPTEPMIWHHYSREYRKTVWDDDRGWHERDAASRARVRDLLLGGCDLDGFGFGSVRSFYDYQEFSGIDYARRTLTPDALAGIWSCP